jgi:type IV pilus assembly protein PilC
VVAAEKFVGALAQLLKKGCSLSDAVDCSIYCIPEKTRPGIIEKLTSAGEGDEITRSLAAAVPQLTPYAGLITQSLATGELANTLAMISARLRYEREVRSQMKSALIYPVILCFIASLAVISMLVFIVPQVQKSLLNTKIEVGLLSQIVFGASNILVQYPIICLFSVIFLLFISAYYRARIFEYVQHLFFSKSLLYKLMSDYELSLFWSYISLAYISSRDLGTSFIEGAGSIKNSNVRAYLVHIGRNMLGDLIIEIKESFDKMKINRYLHRDVVDYWRAAIGIQLRAGSLDLVFGELADFHRDRNEQKIKIISKLSEPIAMIIIGGVIGFISIAMLSPFYEMTQGISSL